ncbi:MAG: TetR/AcrR family transcriptional regulator [Caulobacteraceae bacterium]
MIDKKADILSSGRALFYSKGFKDTNITDIAKMAEISVGTFYNHYASKEKLFLEVFIRESKQLIKSIAESGGLNDDPASLVTKIVMQSISEINSNLILKEWYNRELIGKLEQYLYEQGCSDSIDEFMQSIKAELIKKCKADWKIRDDIDDEMIIAIFNSILYIDIHKSEIGVQYFPQILHYITKFMVKGLAECPK